MVKKKANWISGAISHPGGLHASVGVAPDKKIPAKKLAAASAGKFGPKAKRQAALAKTLKKMN